MPTYPILVKYQGKPTEKIDMFTAQGEAARCLHEYRMAYAALPGQHMHGKVEIWCGSKDGSKKLFE